MDKVNALALTYAAALVEFYATAKWTKDSDLHQDKVAQRKARDAMYNAQEALNTACVLFANS